MSDLKTTSKIKPLIEVGTVYKTNNYGNVTVLEYKRAIEVVVQFDDGTIRVTTKSDLEKGNVGHPTSGIHVGQNFKTKSGFGFKVVEFISPTEVKIQFDCGNVETTSVRDIKSGSIKYRNERAVVGVGYFGYGKFIPRPKTRHGGEHAPEVVYAYWQRMITRCYSESEISKPKGRSYLNVEVSSDFQCFQSFAEWSLSQPNWNNGYELDKDLIGSGYLYSREYCLFLPTSINSFLMQEYKREHHDLPAGVHFLKPGSIGAKDGYVARCNVGSGREYLGYFNDPLQAHLAYKRTKEAYAKELALRYKSDITDAAYNALMNYQVKYNYNN